MCVQRIFVFLYERAAPPCRFAHVLKHFLEEPLSDSNDFLVSQVLGDEVDWDVHLYNDQWLHIDYLWTDQKTIHFETIFITLSVCCYQDFCWYGGKVSKLYISH